MFPLKMYSGQSRWRENQHKIENRLRNNAVWFRERPIILERLPCNCAKMEPPKCVKSRKCILGTNNIQIDFCDCGWDSPYTSLHVLRTRGIYDQSQSKYGDQGEFCPYLFCNLEQVRHKAVERISTYITPSNEGAKTAMANFDWESF